MEIMNKKKVEPTKSTHQYRYSHHFQCHLFPENNFEDSNKEKERVVLIRFYLYFSW
uniref:Uncharacterized protein n=1 Tax=Tetranychus urticae TaxID=32264 RepID=T1KLI7_TETUR